MRKQDIAPVAPIGESEGRPFWSVMIPTYNSPDLLAETLRCVLDQDPGPQQMQIEVVDDASTSAEAQAVVRRVGGTRVSYFRQAHNVGAPANFTTCIDRAIGRWVHILHSDDLVLPGFYNAYRRHIEAHPCQMVVGPARFVGESGEQIRITRLLESSDGILVDAPEVLAKYHPLAFAAVVVARTAYEKVGGFDRALVHANDWEMWTRLAASMRVGYVPVPLAVYRVHSLSDTKRLKQTSLYLTDPLAALDVISARFDDPVVRWRIRYRSRVRLQSMAMATSRDYLADGHLGPAVRNALWAMRLRPSPQSFVLMGAIGRSVAGRATGRASR